MAPMWTFAFGAIWREGKSNSRCILHKFQLCTGGLTPIEEVKRGGAHAGQSDRFSNFGMNIPTGRELHHSNTDVLSP